ncbi:unnamed protein product, partial [Ixodes pacificus]
STKTGNKERGKKKKGSKEKKKSSELKQAPQLKSLSQVAPKADVSPPGASAPVAITAHSVKSGSKEKKGKKKGGSKDRTIRAKREQVPPLAPLPPVVPYEEVPPLKFNLGKTKKAKKKTSKEKIVKNKMEEQARNVPFPEALPLKAPPLGDLVVEPEADTAKRKGSTKKKSKKKKDGDIPLLPDLQLFSSSPWASSGEAPTAETELIIPNRKKKSKENKSKMSKTNEIEALSRDGIPRQELFSGVPLVEHPTAGIEMAQEHYDRRSKKKKRDSKEKKDGLGKYIRLKSDPALDGDPAAQALGSAEESKKFKHKGKKRTTEGADLKPLSPKEAILQPAIIDQGLPAATLPLQMPPGDIGAEAVKAGVERRTKKQKKKKAKLIDFIPLKSILSVNEKINHKEQKRRKKKKGDSTPGEGTPPEGSLEELSSISETSSEEENESIRKENVSTEPEVVDKKAAEKDRRLKKSKAAPLEHARLVPTSSICSVCGSHSTQAHSPGTTVYKTPRFTPTADTGALNYIINVITKYCARISETGDLSARDLDFTILGPSPLGPAGSTVRVIRGDSSLAQMARKSVSRPPVRDIHATRSTIPIVSRERKSASGRRKKEIQRRFIDMMPGTQSTINIPRRKGSVVINVSYPEEPNVPDMTPTESDVSFHCDDDTIVAGHPLYNNYSSSYYHTEPSEFICDCGESVFPDESTFTEYPPDRYQLPPEVPREEFSLPLQSHAVPSLTTEIPPTLQIVMGSTPSVSETERRGQPDALVTVPPVKKHSKLRKQEGGPEPAEQQKLPLKQQSQHLPSPLGLQVKRALQQEQRELLAKILQTQPLPQIQPQQYGQQAMTMPQEQPQWQQVILQPSLLPHENLLLHPELQSQTLTQYLSNAPPLFESTRQQGPHFPFPAMSTAQQQTSQFQQSQQQVLPLDQQQLHLNYTELLQQLLQQPTQAPQQNPEYAQPQVRYQRQPQFDQQCLLALQQELKQELQKQVALLLSQQVQQAQVPQQQSWPQKRSKILLIHQQLQPGEYLESIAVNGQPIHNLIDAPPGVMQQLPPLMPQHLQPGSLQLAPKMQPPPAHMQQFQPLLVPTQYPQIPLQRP